MPWIYEQSTGRLYHNGAFVERGYSGSGSGKNNPAMEGTSNVGPIPRGDYQIGAPFTHPHAGAHTMRLTPVNSTYTYGRNGFMIHGDSRAHPGHASNGCVIEGRLTRDKIWNSGDHILKVVR